MFTNRFDSSFRFFRGSKSCHLKRDLLFRVWGPGCQPRTRSARTSGKRRGAIVGGKFAGLMFRVQGSGYRGDGSGQGYIIGWGVMPYRTHRPDFQGVGFRADPESKSYTSHTFRLEGSGETRLNALKLQGAWFYS